MNTGHLIGKYIPGTLCFLALLAVTVGCSDSASQYIASARAHMAVPDYQSASVDLKNALRINRNLAEARWLLGRIYLDLGEVFAAEKELRLAGETGWNSNDVRPALAKAMLSQGKFSQVLLLEHQDLHPTAASRLLAIQALAELASGRIEAASRLAALARQKSPESPDAILSEARILAQQWNARAAEEIVSALLSSDPDNADAWRLRGQILLQQEKLEEARAAFDQSIALSTIAFSDRVTRALINFQLKDLDAAKIESEILLELSPVHPSAHYIRGLLEFERGEYRLAARSFAKAKPASKQYPLLLYYSSVARLIDGDTKIAAVLAKEYVALKPFELQGRKLLAMIHLQEKDAREAQSVIAPILDYKPNDIDAVKLMANALLLDGEASLAVDLFSRAARLQPDIPVNELGLGLKASGSSPGASGEQSGKQSGHMDVIRINQPDYPLGDILNIVQLLQEENYVSAVRVAELFAWKNTSHLSSYHLLATVYLAASQPAAAKDTLEKALNRDPGNPAASRMLAQIALREGDTDKAVQYYKEALQYYPKDPSLLTGLGSITSKAKNLAIARSLLLQAIEADPDLLEPRLELAAVHLQIGHPDKVAEVFAPLDVLQQRSPKVLALSATASTSSTRQLKTVAAFENSLAEHIDHLPSLFALATRAEKNGDRALLEKYLGPLTRIAAEEPLVLQLRARVASMDGQTIEAALFSERAYIQTPSRENFLSLADYSAEAGRHTATRGMLRRWLEINPHDTAVRVALAVNLEASGNLQDARTEYMRALETDPENLVALNNMAWMMRLDNPDLALEYINRSAADIQHSPALLDTRAVIEHLNGDHASARSTIERAQKLAPDNATIRYHKAMIIAALGMKEEALTSLQELLTGDTGEFSERQEAEALLKRLSEAG